MSPIVRIVMAMLETTNIARWLGGAQNTYMATSMAWANCAGHAAQRAVACDKRLLPCLQTPFLYRLTDSRTDARMPEFAGSAMHARSV